MQQFKKIMRVAMLYAGAMVIAGGFPLSSVMAAEVTPDAQSSEAAPVKPTYTYNKDTQHWDSEKWGYNPTTKSYEKPVTAPAPSSPAPAVETPIQTQQSSSLPSTPDQGTGQTGQTGSSTSQQEATSSNGVGVTQNSTATSGNSQVSGNTTAGNATTGSAVGGTTVINTVHSTVQGDTSGVAHFTSDIYGNVMGDITLSPVINSLSTPPSLNAINTETTNSIDNNISVSATSGNASVSHNTTAGNATSGDAHAMANVVNLINSIIAANKSFIGTINIYGNLNGDILISPDFIPQLIASNAASSSATSGSPVPLVSEDSQLIINTIALNASSGQADVRHNTAAGDATSGAASTNLTVLNLTGRQVTASNSLLVFVNVLGKWVGMIVDAPMGATAAALGSGVTQSTSGGSPTLASTTNSIKNNIELNAQSGDATVAGNTSAGNATSGNATASANVLNISMSSFSLTDWFGVLFINVFGSWYGSFGINTENGTIIPLDVPDALPNSAMQPVKTQASPAIRFGFTPKGAATSNAPFTGGVVHENQGASAQLVRANTTPTSAADEVSIEGDGLLQPNASPRNDPFSVAMTIGGSVIVGFGLLIELFRRKGIATFVV